MQLFTMDRDQMRKLVPHDLCTAVHQANSEQSHLEGGDQKERPSLAMDIEFNGEAIGNTTRVTELAASMQRNGFRTTDPVILSSDGKILDGWHRTRAAILAGVDGVFTQVDEGNEADVVWDRHNHRDSTPSARAMLARKLMETQELSKQEAAKRYALPVAHLSAVEWAIGNSVPLAMALKNR